MLVDPEPKTTVRAGRQIPRILRTLLRSAADTSVSRPSRRVLTDDFFSNKCDRFALRRKIFPVPVT